MNNAYSLNLFVKFAPPRLRVDQLSESLLERFYDWLLRDDDAGRDGARKLDVARKHCSHVSLLWEWASRRDEFSAFITPPRRLADLPHDAKTPTRAPTWEEMDALIAAFAKPPAPVLLEIADGIDVVKSSARANIDWDAQPLGKVLDAELAAALGVSRAAVQKARGLRNIPGYPDAIRGPRALWYALAAAVMRAFGLRVSQATALICADIVIDAAGAGHLRVRGELGKTEQERAGRLVPIGPAVLPVFAELVRDRDPDAFLIPPVGDGKALRERLVRPAVMNDGWRRAGVRTEVWLHRPDHAFRKGFVSGLKKLKADDEAVEVLVGHSLGLRGVYTDPDAQPLKEAAALIPPFSDRAVAVITSAIAEEVRK